MQAALARTPKIVLGNYSFFHYSFYNDNLMTLLLIRRRY